MQHDITKLPLWARVHIASLEQRIERVEQTLPWHEPGMEWFTLMHPRYRQAGDTAHHKLFTCDESGTHCVCSIGPLDTVFVGRGKADRLRAALDPAKIADAFTRWPLPESVCADPCAMKQGPGRFGTNLLSWVEARTMSEQVILPLIGGGSAT